MNIRDYPTVKPSDSYQVLNSDSIFLRDQREFARRERIATCFWLVLAIAGAAVAFKCLM